MKIKHFDVEIDPAHPFKECKLGREPNADVLTKLVGKYEDGFVLAINSEWGTGKTTFVKMWQQQLIIEGYTTIYFNAWENDFEVNPLIAIMAEFDGLTKSESKKTFKSLVEKGAVLTKNIIPQLIKAAASKYIDTAVLVDLIENTAKGAADIFESEIKSYASKKAGLKEFRSDLTKFIQKSSNGKPIIFIVDELDRCRPNYSVEVLEHIKHIFLVPGIVFVLSIDKTQLGHAVRGVYGSELMDANEYLRRFIDVEYTLPQPDAKVFCKYLFRYFEFQQFFYSDKRKQFSEFQSDSEDLNAITTNLFDKASITLRQQEKIFAHTRIAILFCGPDHYIFPDLFLMLVFLKIVHTDFYNEMRRKMFTASELISKFSEFIPKNIDEFEMRNFIRVEAKLVFFYNNYISERRSRTLITVNKETGESECSLKSNLTGNGDQHAFLNTILYLAKNHQFQDLSITYLLTKIELTGNIQI